MTFTGREERPTIPDKLYFKIGEVAALTSLKPSVLRFWETEFGGLRPSKSRNGQRLYTRQDIERILEIKGLLYTEKLTIEGARKRLKEKRGSAPEPAGETEAVAGNNLNLIREVREELRKLRDSL